MIDSLLLTTWLDKHHPVSSTLQLLANSTAYRIVLLKENRSSQSDPFDSERWIYINSNLTVYRIISTCFLCQLVNTKHPSELPTHQKCDGKFPSDRFERKTTKHYDSAEALRNEASVKWFRCILTQSPSGWTTTTRRRRRPIISHQLADLNTTQPPSCFDCVCASQPGSARRKP